MISYIMKETKSKKECIESNSMIYERLWTKKPHHIRRECEKWNQKNIHGYDNKPHK